MAWRFKRTVISAFVAAHVAALVLWNLPAGALHDRVAPHLGWYFYPTGLWQDWGMFAPEPGKSTCALEALTRDRHGFDRTFAYPGSAERSPWEGFWTYRDSKLAAVAALDQCVAHREFIVRHALRRLQIPADAFPVDVDLVYQVTPTPPPFPAPPKTAETDEPEVPTEPYVAVIQSYHFPSLEEIQP